MSKGSKQRPLSISRDEYAEKYARTFNPARCDGCGGVLEYADGEPMGWTGYTRWSCTPCTYIRYIKNDPPPEAA